MRVVILADRLGRELLPLTDNTCVALLPVAGKPVIEHTLDLLAGAGVKEAVVALSSHAEQVRALLGDGRRWGMALSYWPTRGEESPAAVLGQIPESPHASCLLIRGDMVRAAKLADFLARASASGASLAYGLIEGRAAGFALCSGPLAEPGPLHWPALASSAEPDAAAGVELGPGAAHSLESLADYHRANQEAAAGRIDGLLLPGRETALGLTQGRNTRISPRSLKVGAAFVGSACRVHDSAELSGVVVISDHVIVDRQARLTDSVILPHTYVGELVDIKNAIVRGNDLIRVDTGAHLRLTDAFLLADLRQTTLGGSLAAPLNRLGGALLLLLSLPLWPLAALAGFLGDPKQPFRRVSLRGNRVALDEFGRPQRAEFSCGAWSTPVPVLRHLPRLWAVAMGDLRLVGVEPVTLEQAGQRAAEWERLADNAPAGLIGPTQLRLDADAPEEERLMSDAFYASQRGPGTDGRCLLEGCLALFGRRAWLGRG